MNKKVIITTGAAVLFVGAMLIPQVQAAAESALSVFRVNDAKTIKITATDLQEITDYAKKAGMSDPKAETKSKTDVMSELSTKIKSEVRPISRPKEFTGFAFNLPQALKSEQPKLFAVDAKSQTITLDTNEINAELKKLGGTPLDSSYNGVKITVNTPPAAIAEYDSVTLIETQGIRVDAQDNAVNALWSDFVGLPMIPADLRVQLAAVEPTGGDVYLPVIEGLGRQTDLGGATGYVYSAKDLSQVASVIPGLSDSSRFQKLSDSNDSALIWVKNGVLYVLAGNKTDSELSQIARSIRS